MPSFWYQVELLVNSEYFVGASFAGIPMILIGRTSEVAWGVTVNLRDSAYLYEEKLSEDSKTYLLDNKWRPLREKKIEIEIKKQEKYIKTLKSTHRGPILDFLFGGRNVSILMNTLRVEDDPFDGAFNLLFCKSVNETIKSIGRIFHPSLNFIFADNNGDIGYYHSSKKLLFKNPLESIYFMDGSRGENDPLGYMPPDEEYYVINPKKGYIASANNLAVSGNEKYRTNIGLHSTSRALRIKSIIEEDYIKKGRKIR